MTGIFVDSARVVSDTDRDFLIARQQQDAKECAIAMYQLFREFDVNNSGSISLQEFEQIMDDERAAAYLKSMELDFSQASIMFSLLDAIVRAVWRLENFWLVVRS